MQQAEYRYQLGNRKDTSDPTATKERFPDLYKWKCKQSWMHMAPLKSNLNGESRILHSIEFVSSLSRDEFKKFQFFTTYLHYAAPHCCQ